MINSQYYDENSKIITMDPGQTFWLKVFWNYRLDDRTWVFTKLKVISEVPVSGAFARTHAPTEFSVRASVQLFPKFAPARSLAKQFILSMQGRISPPP
jgi:hypothetical protein